MLHTPRLCTLDKKIATVVQQIICRSVDIQALAFALTLKTA